MAARFSGPTEGTIVPDELDMVLIEKLLMITSVNLIIQLALKAGIKLNAAQTE